MKLVIAARAEREIERKAASWAKHSTVSPELFWDELRRVIRRLEVEPYAGRRWTSPSEQSRFQERRERSDGGDHFRNDSRSS